MDWSLDEVVRQSPVPACLADDIDELVELIAREARPGDRVVVMSNGGFGGIHQRLLRRLEVDPLGN
jgi:UDP-N-acetylmuramate: L-alanyl-gamma-D-glutamyl-meso-diaminopimelate ligase